MDGFKPVVKMKCGGSVTKAVEKCGGGRMKEGGKVMHDDIKEDKKLIKKAVNLHDDQLHEGKKTDLSTLKKGGRAKKETGTVRKYKAGGKVKKMADGGSPAPIARVSPDEAPSKLYDKAFDRGYNSYKQDTWPSDKKAASEAGHAAGREAKSEFAREANRAQVMQQVNYSQNKKRGGKVKKMADGGLTSPVLQAALNADQLRKRKAMMGVRPDAAPLGQPMPQDIGAAPAMPPMKRGGKVKK